MRPRHFIPLLALFTALPAPAQIPISGVGNAGGPEIQAMRRWLRRADDQPDRVHNRQRRAELAGQIGQLYRRIDRLRESGQITRAEARQMRREVARVTYFYSAYRGSGLSDSEAAELQNRIYYAGSLVQPTRSPPRRAGR